MRVPIGYSTTHNHADPDVLTAYCGACVLRVKSDQRQAEIDAAPKVELVVEWYATSSTRGTVMIEVPAMPDEKPDDVAERNADEITTAIDNQLPWETEWDVDYEKVTFTSVKPDAPITAPMPTLLDVAS